LERDDVLGCEAMFAAVEMRADVTPSASTVRRDSRLKI